MIYFSLTCAAVFLASAGILAAIFVSATMEKITVEVGETPLIENIHDSSFLSSLYSAQPYSIDVSEPGEHVVDLCFFGFFPGKVVVEVRDTTPPELVLTNVKTVAGTVITADDFVVSCTDATEITILPLSDDITDKTGEYKIQITASDAEGNTTIGEAELTVWDSSHILAAEFDAENLERIIREQYPEVTELDLTDISTHVIGQYILHATSEDASYILPVNVSDTTPPKAEVKNFAVRKGTVPTAEEYVTSINDASPYMVAFARERDVSKEGLHIIRIKVEDIHHNSVEVTAKLLVADIPEKITVEYGASAEAIEKTVLADTTQKHRFTVSECPTEPGEYTVEVLSDYGSYLVSVTIADTTPPEMILNDVTVYKGDAISPESFIREINDLSEVSFEYSDKSPSSDTPGKMYVRITASDKFGNKTQKTAVLYVLDDTTPPVICGVADKFILAGDTVSFKKGVYAVDDRDGEVAFKVDSSAVNTSAAGKYPVIYTSVDSSGNEARITSYVTVTLINMDSVNELADNILARILTTSMTDREKAWAVYVWSTESLKYSTRTSHLMGNYVEGAYSGFTIRTGNCYIYYAVTSVLLTRAGIENIMIQRDKPNDPHYWNLVKIDGSWYHLDTCPHFPEHQKKCFLWTDADLADYNKNEVADYYSFDASLYPASP